MITEVDVIRSCENNFWVIVESAFCRLSVRCLRCVSEFLQNCQRSSSNSTVSVINDNVDFILRTTASGDIRRSSRTRCNTVPLQTSENILLIVPTYCGVNCTVGNSVLNGVGSCKCATRYLNNGNLNCTAIAVVISNDASRLGLSNVFD